MLEEFKNVRQEKDEYRRLFSDNTFDLYVWYAKKGGEIIGFQLVYKSGKDVPDISQKAFTWTQKEGFSHLDVEGWDNTAYEGTPLLVLDGAFEYHSIIKILREQMQNIEEDIRTLVLGKIEEYRIQ